MTTPTTRRTPAHYRGCLLGGAVGDALGAPVEFLDLAAIRATYGPDGIADFDEAYGRVGAITDDTQMTLFTAEGLLRAYNRWSNRGICNPASVVHRAYLRWLHTQGIELAEPVDPFEPQPFDGWLVRVPELHARRGPGHTCVTALRSGLMGTPERPINDSKGCGGIMRVAPVGLFANSMTVFELGCETAAITHGHPSGYLAAGALAVIIHEIVEGRSLEDAVAAALDVVASRPGSGECVRALETAILVAGGSEAGGESPTARPPRIARASREARGSRTARASRRSPESVERLGAGWVAEEALAIAVYCALVAGEDFAFGVRLAVNHSGDSDSTGAITGNILGALLGEDAIPERWREQVELRDTILQLADDLYTGWRDDEEWQERYPGW